jgi:WD40 repeat protein
VAAAQNKSIGNLLINSPAVMGYVPRRKRRTQDLSEAVQEDPSTSILSPYLPFSDITHSPPGKQAKYGVSVPKYTKKRLTAHTKPVLSMQWHPNSPHLLLSASLDGGVRLWDVTKEKECVETYNFHSAAAVRYIDWATNTAALSAGYDRNAVYMDIGYAREIARLKHSAYVSVVKSHPLDRNLVVTGDHDGKLQMWDLRDSKCTKLYRGACGKILDIAFLPNCDAFVASADIVRRNAFSQAMNVWDLNSGVTLSHQLYFEPFTCPCLKVNKGRGEFLAQSNGNYTVLFSATKPFKLNKRKRFQGHFVSGFDVGFDLNPEGSVLCSASSEGRVHFYDYITTKQIRSLTLTDSATLAVTWNRNFPFKLAVSDWKGAIHVLQ